MVNEVLPVIKVVIIQQHSIPEHLILNSSLNEMLHLLVGEPVASSVCIDTFLLGINMTLEEVELPPSNKQKHISEDAVDQWQSKHSAKNYYDKHVWLQLVRLQPILNRPAQKH